MNPVRASIASLGLLALVGLAGPAAAQPETEQQVQDRLTAQNFAIGGYYIGVEGLVAVENSPVVGLNSTIVSGGLDIRLGFRHNRWLATEIYGLYVHTYGDGTGNYLAWGMSINERFYLTRRRIQPFLTAGVGFLQVSSRQPAFVAVGGTSGFDPGFAPLFGVGLEIYATESVVFTIMANYHLTLGKISGFDFITGGVGMQFF